jgi:type IV pilus assembly protein PilQ
MNFSNIKKISLLIVVLFLSLSLFSCRSGPELAKDPDRGAKLGVENINPANTGKNLKDDANKLVEQQTSLLKLNTDEKSSSSRRTNLYGSKSADNNKSSAAPIKIEDLNAHIKKLENAPVTIKMDDINIHAALKLFASLVNRNIIIGEEVDGTVSLDFDKVKWGAAVYAVLDMKGLVMSVDDSSKLLTVHTKSKYLQLEKDKIDATKIRQRNLNSLNDRSNVISDPNSSLEDSAVFKIYYQTSKDMSAKIKEIISKDDLDGDLKIVEDEKNNQIVVTGTERQLSKVESILDTFDVKKQQILIEAYIVNAKDTFERKLGARVGANYVNQGAKNGAEQISGVTGSTSGVAAGTTDTSGTGLAASGLAIGTAAGSLADFSFSGTSGIGIIGRLGMARLKVEINALEAEGISETISNPKVYAMDGEEAIITQGQQIPYTVAGGANIASSTQFVNANLNLKVRPKIIGDGKILLDLDLVNDAAGTAAANSAPPIDKQNFKSKITIDDRSIAVLGGVYTTTKGNSVNKTPLLGDLPVLGNLFKSTNKQDDKTQLLVFITATII